MKRETQNILLILLGGALLKISWNGTYLRYVKPSLLPWLVVAGIVMVVLAVVAIVRDLATRPPGRHSAPACASGDDHGHDDKGSRSPWLLLLPVLAIFLIAPPALGSESVKQSNNRAVGAGQPSEQKSNSGVNFEPLPAGEAVPLRMSDFVTRVVWDDSGTLNGRAVRLTGFIARGEQGQVYLARLVISCCVGDAMPVKVNLHGKDELKNLATDNWFEATGKVVPNTASEANGYVPNFTVSEIKQVPAPAEPYES